MSVIPFPESLNQLAKRLKDLTKAGLMSELLLSEEVEKVSKIWDSTYRETAGVEFGKWLRLYVDPTRDLRWYLGRAIGHRLLKREGIGEKLESAAVVWLSTRMPTPEKSKNRDEIIREVDTAWRTNNKVPLKLTQVTRLLRPFVNPPSRLGDAKRLRDRIIRLEKQIRSLGHVPVD